MLPEFLDVYCRESHPNTRLVNIAMECVGLPVAKFDNKSDLFKDGAFNGCCSFIRFCLFSSGVPVPDYINVVGEHKPLLYVNEFFDHFGVLVDIKRIKSGDLVFFSRRGERPQHIGMYLGDNKYIHAPSREGVVKVDELHVWEIPNLSEKAIYFNNPIGVKRAVVPTSHPRWTQALLCF